jgi:hypothetical protein
MSFLARLGPVHVTIASEGPSGIGTYSHRGRIIRPDIINLSRAPPDVGVSPTEDVHRAVQDL